MYNEPLTFDVVPGKTADTRIFRLHGPITLANLFDFQKVLNAGTEKLTSSHTLIKSYDTVEAAEAATA